MKKQLLNLFLTVVCIFTVSIVRAQYQDPQSTLEFPAVETEDAVPVIDGVGDDAAYSDLVQMTIGKEAGAAAAAYDLDGNEPDFNAKFAVCWDKKYLYLYVEVVDDIFDPYLNGSGNSWTWDNFEVFIDLDTNSTTNTYDVASTAQLRFAPGLETDGGDDSIIESRVRADYADFMTAWEEGNGYTAEIAIPWVCASADALALGEYDIVAQRDANTVVGFDIAVADSDSDGSVRTEGGRNVAGGQQMFWDLDDPALSGNEDNAYQNRRVFGFAELIGDPYVVGLSDLSTATVDVFPNPVVDQLNIKNYNGPVTIYSVIGTQVMDIENTNGVVDLSKLNSGVYIIATEAGNARIIKK